MSSLMLVRTYNVYHLTYDLIIEVCKTTKQFLLCQLAFTSNLLELTFLNLFYHDQLF